MSVLHAPGEITASFAAQSMGEGGFALHREPYVSHQTNILSRKGFKHCFGRSRTCGSLEPTADV